MGDEKKEQVPSKLEDSLSLKEFIRAVQNELIESEKERVEEGMSPLFKVDSLEIEASVVVKQSVKGEGGLNIQVISLGASGGLEKEAAHRITLKLSTIGEDDIPITYDWDGDFTGEHPDEEF